MRAVVVVASLTACFSKPPPPTGLPDGGRRDATSTDSSPKDAAPLCAHWGDFATPPTELMLPGAPGTGAQHVTVSDDGLEVMFDVTGSLYESIRTDTAQPFVMSQTVPGFALSGSEAAWLSLDRLILFYIDGSTVYATPPRQAVDTGFSLPGTLVVNGADHAAATSDRLRVAHSAGVTIELLTFSSPGDPNPVDSPLADDTTLGKHDGAPSIGDHGRKVVWAQNHTNQPELSVLIEADFDGAVLTNPHDLMLNTGQLDTDPNLSNDGTTLYFTSTRDSNDPTAQLFVTTRTCN